MAFDNCSSMLVLKKQHQILAQDSIVNAIFFLTNHHSKYSFIFFFLNFTVKSFLFFLFFYAMFENIKKISPFSFSFNKISNFF